VARDPGYGPTTLYSFSNSSRTSIIIPYNDPDETLYNLTMNDLQFINDSEAV
jgi:hypothetical protein